MDNLSALRLMQLVSPSLPTGAFSYSQGLEWAVEYGWVKDGIELVNWLEDILKSTMCSVDLPLLRLMYKAYENDDLDQLKHLCNILLACRESSEMQQEDINRGRAMTSLLEGLSLLPDPEWKKTLNKSQLAGYAIAAQRWNISIQDASLGYIWSWLENQVLAGVKIIPLGQTEGQRILSQLSLGVSDIITKAQTVPLEEIGASSPALALASSYHETQYTRIYRS